MNELIKQLQYEKRGIYNNSYVPRDELQLLIFSTYCCANISEGKACEMLGVDRITFRDMFNKWFEQNEDMQEVFDLVTNKIFERSGIE